MNVRTPRPARLAQNRDRVGALGVHRAHHHQIAGADVAIGNLIESVVEQAQAPRRRTERGHRDQTQRRSHGGFGQHFQNALEAPEGRGKLRPDQKDLEIPAQGREQHRGRVIREDGEYPVSGDGGHYVILYHAGRRRALYFSLALSVDKELRFFQGSADY